MLPPRQNIADCIADLPTAVQREAARENTYQGFCFRCLRHIGEQTGRDKEPVLCGPCHHDVAAVGAREAVRRVMDVGRESYAGSKICR